ncbi:hypothetical protein CL655_03560 [bacterium]|nr:hypothetical protein [bacterium]|tara:strand:- start:1609 stop:2064 length:456 start_codon:yes stop_codon:yes gene_type:complete
MDELTKFLQTQTVIQISPKAGEPWIANVMMTCETPEQLYFVGSTKRLYGQQLLADETLAFATAWHEVQNHANRKGVQGVGIARPVTSEAEMSEAVALHNRDYPALAEQVTFEVLRENTFGLHVWCITPTFIKFWNDELYGRDGTETFTFGS